MLMCQSMFPKNIFPEVISFFPENGVDVISIIQKANIVIFNQKVRAVDDVIVRFHGFVTSDPCKIDLIHSTSMQFGQGFFSFQMIQISSIFFDQIMKDLLLVFR